MSAPATPARNPKFWDHRGKLTPAGRIEVARLMKAGMTPPKIGAALGMSRSAAGTNVRRIQKTLGMKTVAEKRADDNREIAERWNAGEDACVIAGAIGRSEGAVKQMIWKLQGRRVTKVKFTADEKSEIYRRLRAGESSYAIARSMGCSQGGIAPYCTEVRVQMQAKGDQAPTCECGKPSPHTGICRLHGDRLAKLQEMVRAGATGPQIAVAIGLGKSSVNLYMAEYRRELEHAGGLCGCGFVNGHAGPCSANPRLRPDFLPRLRELLTAGVTRNEAAIELGVWNAAITIHSRGILEDLAAAGAECRCGRPLNHRSSCWARRANPRDVLVWRAQPTALSPRNMQRLITNRLRKGMAKTSIAADLDCPVGDVAAVEQVLMNDGEVLPDCSCGLTRDHRGACRPKPTVSKARYAPRRLPSTLPKAVLRRMRQLFTQGKSIAYIAEEAGVSHSAAARHVKYWKETVRVPLKACACGRPARHKGGCHVNTPLAVSPMVATRIADMVLSGASTSDIVSRFGIAHETALVHSVVAREELMASGRRCDCGRPIAHIGICSANWETGGRIRGPRSLPRRVAARVRQLLLQGEMIPSIRSTTGLSEMSIRRVNMALSVEDRRERSRLIRERRRLGSDGDYLAKALAAVKAAAPTGVEKSLRDEIVSEAYLAIVEGRLDIEQLGPAMKAFRSAAYSRWASSFGPRSMDEAGAHDGRTLSDRLGDTTTAQGIDAIEIGQPPP